jgi:hypothetical protein
MRKNVYNFLYRLRVYGVHVFIGFGLLGFLTALILILFGQVFLAIISPILAVILMEGFYRSVFLIGCGLNYRYYFEPYLIVHHPEYGRCIRPNVQIRNVKTILFDKYIFPSLPGPIDSIEHNIAARFDLNTNNKGYRGPEIYHTNNSQDFTIFCSGGSTTACYGDDSQTWPARLQAILNETRKNVRVINGGVWSWSSTEEVKRLQLEIDEIQPDVVVLHQGWNEEFLQALFPNRTVVRPNKVRSPREQELWLQSDSIVLRFAGLLTVNLLATAWKRYRLKHDLSFHSIERWKVLTQRLYIQNWSENLHTFCSLAETHKFLLYTINPPGLASINDSYTDRETYIQELCLNPRFAEYQAISKSIVSNTLTAWNEIIPCLDIEKYFKSITGVERTKIFRDDQHLTPSGDAILAEKLANLLLSDDNFHSRLLKNQLPMTNVCRNDITIGSVEYNIYTRTSYTDRFLRTIIQQLNDKISPENYKPQEDMYTIF